MRSIIFFMLIAVPLSIWTQSYNFIYIKEIILSVSLMFIFISFISAKKISISKQSLFAFLIPLWLIVSFSLSKYQSSALSVASMVLILVLLFVILANQVAVNKDIIRVLFLLSGIPVVLIGLGQVLFPAVFTELLAFNLRIPATLGNPNFFAAYIIVFVPFVLTQAEKLKQFKLFFTVALLALAIFLLYKTGSKGAFAALAVEMLIYFIVSFSKNKDLKVQIKKNMAAVLIAVIAIGLAVIMLIHNTDSMKFRINVWTGTAKLIALNPIFGSGPGSFSVAFPVFRPVEIIKQSYKHSYEVSYPENILLQTAAEYGLVGLAILLFILWIILKKIEPEKGDYYAAFCGLIAVNLTGVDINYGTSAMLAAVFAGTLLNGRKVAFVSLANSWRKIVIVLVPIIIVIVMTYQFAIHISDIYLKRAISLSETKQWQAAIDDYSQALLYNKNNVPANYFLASAYYDFNPELNGLIALKTFEAVEKLAPNYVLLHYKKGVVLKALGRQDEAVAEYNKMLLVDPYLTPALMDLSYIYYIKGDLDLAEKYMKRASDNSNNAALFNNLGNIYFMQKRVPEAIIAYKKSIEINPDKDYYYNLGCVYFTLHEIVNAKFYMFKAAEIDSKNGSKELKIQNMLKQIRQYERRQK